MRTKAGAWAVSEAEASFIEKLVDADEKWDKMMEGCQEWINKPIQPPGLSRSGKRGGCGGRGKAVEGAGKGCRVRREDKGAAIGGGKTVSGVDQQANSAPWPEQIR